VGPLRLSWQKTDEHTEEKTGGRIAPAQSKINRHEQREIEYGGPRKMNWE